MQSIFNGITVHGQMSPTVSYLSLFMQHWGKGGLPGYGEAMLSIFNEVRLQCHQLYPTLASSCSTEAKVVFQAMEKPCRASLMGSDCKHTGPTGSWLGMPSTWYIKSHSWRIPCKTHCCFWASLWIACKIHCCFRPVCGLPVKYTAASGPVCGFPVKYTAAFGQFVDSL